jgi:deoxyribose-phosphate aldolase
MAERPTGRELARMIDHTLLKPDADAAAIDRLCAEALAHGFYSVCVNGMWVARCRERLAGSPVKVSAVCGFPLGATHTRVKAYEAARAVEDGAAEIDMVLPVGALLAGDAAAVRADIRGVVDAVQGQALVKVILETGYLNDAQIRLACRLAAEAGAHFVKTSTGFGPGGATVEHVRLMRASVPEAMGVKASGGVRDAAAALRMIEAGATRIGTSSGVAIVTGLGCGEGDGGERGGRAGAGSGEKPGRDSVGDY